MIRRQLILALLVAAALPVSASAKPAKSKDTSPPVITHVRIEQSPQGQPIVVRARIDDASEIFAPAVYVRAQGASEFVTIAMVKVRDGFEAVVPAEQVNGPLEYFIEAFDEEGNGPAREGTPEAPFAITMGGKVDPTPPIGTVVPPPPPDGNQVVKPVDPKEPDDGGIVTRWWFWTIIGVAVTGGIVATVLLTRPSDPLDYVNIEVRGPDPTEGL